MKMRRAAATFLFIIFLQATLLAQDHTVIALSHDDYTVYELNPVSGKIVSQFKAEHQPHEGVVTADGKTVYASIPSAGHVIVLDATQNLKLIKKIESEYFTRAPRPKGGSPGGGNEGNTNSLPHGVVLSLDGSKLYITVQWAEVPGIVVYDTKTGRVVKKIDILLEGGRQLAIDPRTEKMYYPMYDDDRVVVIDTRNDKVINIIPVKGKPVSVDFTQNGEAWIHSDGDGSVSVIDTKSDEVVKRIETGGKGMGRTAVSPDGRYAASSRSETNDVIIIDARTKQVLGKVPIEGMSYPIFSPDSTKLYVMNRKPDGGVSVVDVKAMKVEARYKVGTFPFGGAIRKTR
jgi:Uncharacterized conserved protein